MIRRARFCINHSSKIRKFASADAQLQFERGYNVLIGPNGSGKSTVLRAIATCSMCTVDGVDRERIMYITTETLNPLVGGHFSSREQMIQGIRAMFKSHGQSVFDSLQSQCHANETVSSLTVPRPDKTTGTASSFLKDS